MDTDTEIIQSNRALTREALRGPEACEHCGDWVMDHPHCQSCNAVVCEFGLCAGCVKRSKDVCRKIQPEVRELAASMASGLMSADDAADALGLLVDRLCDWDVVKQ